MEATKDEIETMLDVGKKVRPKRLNRHRKYLLKSVNESSSSDQQESQNSLFSIFSTPSQNQENTEEKIRDIKDQALSLEERMDIFFGDIRDLYDDFQGIIEASDLYGEPELETWFYSIDDEEVPTEGLEDASRLIHSGPKSFKSYRFKAKITDSLESLGLVLSEYRCINSVKEIVDGRKLCKKSSRYDAKLNFYQEPKSKLEKHEEYKELIDTAFKIHSALTSKGYEPRSKDYLAKVSVDE